jgi:hypothetical protein
MLTDSNRQTWTKIPAAAEAFYLHPTAQWIWLLDTDAILMNNSIDILSSILRLVAIAGNIMRSTPILDDQLAKNSTNISTPTSPRIQDIDVLLTQDHQSLNTGSVFFRCSSFTRVLLEIMTDYPLLMGKDHINAEQDALKHLVLEHELVRQHVGFFSQRKLNAYVNCGPIMGYRDSDLLVHLAGCWTGGKCEDFWAGSGGRGRVWRPEEKGRNEVNTLEARYPTRPKPRPGPFRNATRLAASGSAF